MSNPEIELQVSPEPAHYRYFDLSTAGLRVTGWSALIFGWVLINPSGSAAAEMDLYDSDSASGQAAMSIGLAASESASDWFGDRGVLFKNGVFCNVTTGEVRGSLLYRHLR